MAFEGYYVGSNLTDLGNNITRDMIAKREADRLTHAQLLDAWKQQVEMARLASQDRQFAQELAFRQTGQGQANAYQNALLELQKQQMQFGQNSMTAEQQAQNKFGYAQLANQLEIGKLGNPQVTTGLIKENSTIDAESAASQAKADRYNQMYMSGMAGIDLEYPKTGVGAVVRAITPFVDSRPEQIQQQHGKVWSSLLDKLAQDPDKTPVQISGEGRFVPVLKPKFQMGQGVTQSQPGQAGNQMEQLLNALHAIQSGTSTSTNAPAGLNPSDPTPNPLTNAVPQQAPAPAGRGWLPAFGFGGGSPAPAITNAPSRAAAVGYQAELNQLNAAAQGGAIDRATYIQLRQALDRKYGTAPH